MNPWSINPVWQNFSSLCREVSETHASKNEISRYHHLTSALYFAVATVESFLNQQMRLSLTKSKTEEEIYEILRKARFPVKLKTWPEEILGCKTEISEKLLLEILEFNDIRGNLTHPKTTGHDLYGLLESLDPLSVKRAVAEYCIRFLERKGEPFPYWYIGWNYFNPRPNTQEIWMFNNQQFLHSLAYLGFSVPSFNYGAAKAWEETWMSTFEGYVKLQDVLDKIDHCEPKDERFPFKPIICRSWWTTEHQKSCGNVTLADLAKAK